MIEHHPHRTTRRDVRAAGTRTVGSSRPPTTGYGHSPRSWRHRRGVRSRHRRADAALRAAPRHRAGQVRPRPCTCARWPLARSQVPRRHTAAGVRDEADRPLAPRAAPAGLKTSSCAQRRWRQEVDQWFDHDRSAQLAKNRALQAVEPGALDDVELAAHISSVLSHFEQSARRNLATHGGDLVPSGDLLAHCEAWGISANEAAGLLTGSSPATVETAVMLRSTAPSGTARVPTASLAWSTTCVRSVPDLASSRRRLARSEHVAHSQHRRRRLPHPGRGSGIAAGGVARCHRATRRSPAEQRFARVPAEDRASSTSWWPSSRGHRQRDDIRGLCWNWPCGLVRRASWKPGGACTQTEACTRVAHVVELFPDELDRLLLDRALRDTDGPSADELAERAAERDRIEATPRRLLGEPRRLPTRRTPEGDGSRHRSAHGQPRRRRHATAADDEPSTVSGVGVGDTTYRGRACVVRDLMLAFDQLEPGDVWSRRSPDRR